MNNSDLRLLIKIMKDTIYSYNLHIKQNELFSGSIADFYKPIYEYRLDKSKFPESNTLHKLIADHTSRIYGQKRGEKVNGFLSRHFIADTATHYCFPRSYDNLFGIAYDSSITWNSYLLSAALSKWFGEEIHFGIYTTQIAFTTVNSPAILEIGRNKYESIVSKKDKASFVCLSKINPDKFDHALKLLEKTAEDLDEQKLVVKIRQLLQPEDDFSEATILIHKHLLDNFLNSDILGIEQITVTSDLVTDFLVSQLRDKNSIYYDIFGVKENMHLFAKTLAGIRSGWKNNEFPFVFATDKKRLEHRPFSGNEYDTETLIELLESKNIFPTTILRIAILLLAGMLPIGGMLQSAYAAETKEKLCYYLERIGYSERSSSIKNMPVDLSMHVCAPFVKDTMELYNFNELKNIIKADGKIMEKSVSVPMKTAFYYALPTLYQFFTYYVSSKENTDYRKNVLNLWKKDFDNAVLHS